MGQIFSRSCGLFPPSARVSPDGTGSAQANSIHGSRFDSAFTAPQGSPLLGSGIEWSVHQPSQSSSASASNIINTLPVAWTTDTFREADRRYLLQELEHGQPDAGRQLCQIALCAEPTDALWAQQVVLDKVFTGQPALNLTGRMIRFELFQLYQEYRQSRAEGRMPPVSGFESPSAFLIMVGFEAMDRGFFDIAQTVAAQTVRLLQPPLIRGPSGDLSVAGTQTHELSDPFYPLSVDRIISSQEITCVFRRLQDKQVSPMAPGFRLNPPLPLTDTRHDEVVSSLLKQRVAAGATACAPLELFAVADSVSFGVAGSDLRGYGAPVACTNDWALLALTDYGSRRHRPTLCVFSLGSSVRTSRWQTLADNLGIAEPSVKTLPEFPRRALFQAGGVMACHLTASILCDWAERGIHPNDTMNRMVRQFAKMSLVGCRSFNTCAREELLVALSTPTWHW